jgi:quinoprotein glucose dehydrogenase
MKVMREGRGAMPPMPQVPADAAKALADFLLARDRPPSSAPPAGGTPYIHASFRRMMDHEGYPGIKPPWGTLNCIDLNTGKLAWKVRLGAHPELETAGVPKTGTENYGGATTTAGGLVFCSGTRDGKIRAFDSRTGDELWAGDLPHDGSTPPTTYEIDGRQYVVVAAMGVRMLRGPEGDAWVAFALHEGD